MTADLLLRMFNKMDGLLLHTLLCDSSHVEVIMSAIRVGFDIVSSNRKLDLTKNTLPCHSDV
jgi:hypothetical protein